MLIIFLAKNGGQLVVQLSGGEVRGFDLSHQRQRNLARQVHLIIAGEIVGLENLDAHSV